MSDVEAILRRIAIDLKALGVSWALVGAMAVGVRSEPRFTRDADLVVSVASDAEAERIVRDLNSAGYRVEAVVEQETAGRLAAARLLPPGEDPGGGPVLDLLFSSCGIESEIVREATTVEVTAGLALQVAATGHLIAMKLLARSEARPQDEIDLRALIAEADVVERERARAAVEMICARGYQRGRDLVRDLETALSESPDLGATR